MSLYNFTEKLTKIPFLHLSCKTVCMNIRFFYFPYNIDSWCLFQQLLYKITRSFSFILYAVCAFWNCTVWILIAIPTTFFSTRPMSINFLGNTLETRFSFFPRSANHLPLCLSRVVFYVWSLLGLYNWY